MSPITKAISRLFSDNSLFQTRVAKFTKNTPAKNIDNTDSFNNNDIDLVGYLNPAHPYYIHIVESNELSYLNSLTNTQQNELIEQLANSNAGYIVFTAKQVNNQQVPLAFFQQNKINIICFSGEVESPYQYLINATQNIPIEETSIHGSMVVVYNQGILITGDSGTGKSTLLLSILDRGHLWVSDDAPHIYRNHTGEIYGGAIYEESIEESIKDADTRDSSNEGYYAEKSSTKMLEYIHTKNTGVINADQTYGKSKRIPRHTLAAIIHLSNNVDTDDSDDGIFTGCQMINILGKAIPKWSLSLSHENRAMLVECIAKQLILNSWGDNAAEALINTTK